MSCTIVLPSLGCSCLPTLVTNTKTKTWSDPFTNGKIDYRRNSTLEILAEETFHCKCSTHTCCHKTISCEICREVKTCRR